jgi:hypothetical protein
MLGPSPHAALVSHLKRDSLFSMTQEARACSPARELFVERHDARRKIIREVWKLDLELFGKPHAPQTSIRQSVNRNHPPSKSGQIQFSLSDCSRFSHLPGHLRFFGFLETDFDIQVKGAAVSYLSAGSLMCLLSFITPLTMQYIVVV